MKLQLSFKIAILRFKMTILRNQTTAVRYNTIFGELQETMLQLWHIKSLTLYIFYFEVETGFHTILSCLKVKCVTSCSCFSLLWDVCIPGAVCHLNTDSLARLPSTLRARAVARSSTTLAWTDTATITMTASFPSWPGSKMTIHSHVPHLHTYITTHNRERAHK